MFENAFNSIDRELRNEEGLASELDYAEQTSWILFLKYLDDIEQERQDEAELEGTTYTPTLPTPMRWKTWASATNEDGTPRKDVVTGEDLIAFVNTKLFPTLKKYREDATSPDTIEYKIGEIFSEITNKFRSGYSLRDVLEIVDGLEFNNCPISMNRASSAWATPGAMAANTTRRVR